jgi:hypothetical protein
LAAKVTHTITSVSDRSSAAVKWSEFALHLSTSCQLVTHTAAAAAAACAGAVTANSLLCL